MTTDEFLKRTQEANGAQVEAERSGPSNYRVSVVLHMTKGRLYQTKLIDGTCARTSPEKFRKEYEGTIWTPVA